VTAHLDPLATHLLQLLPSDGSSLGNAAVRQRLGEALGQPVGLEAFAAAVDTLLSAGAVTKGRGRGGSLRLSDGMREALADAPATAQLATHASARRARRPPGHTHLQLIWKNLAHAHR